MIAIFFLYMFYVGMENISFTSRIRPVSIAEFRNTVNRWGDKRFVAPPWTIKESVLKDSAYTSNILDCTVCGLTDGHQVLLMHICPTNPKNNSFNIIERFIKDRICLNNSNLQGFILGSKLNNPETPHSEELFEKFVKFMKDYKIPFSQFKGGPFENFVAYSSAKDEWLIGNYLVSDASKHLYHSKPKNILERIFDKVAVSDADEVAW